MTSQQVTPYQSQIVWWRCIKPTCRGEWQEEICNIVQYLLCRKCPKKKQRKWGPLSIEFPHIAKE